MVADASLTRSLRTPIDLRNVNLRDVDLEGADLRYADLRGRPLDPEKLVLVRDRHVRMSLRLQDA